MKILGISGSQRKGQNSYALLTEAMKGAKEVDPSAETEILEFSDLKIGPCLVTCPDACTEHAFSCTFKDDFHKVLDEMKTADGILIATPRYFLFPSKLQAFMERLYRINYSAKFIEPSSVPPFSGKPFGLLIASGSEAYSVLPMLDHLMEFFLWLQMRWVGSKSWPFKGVAGKDPISEDKHALEEARTLGRYVAKAVAGKR